MDCKTPYILNMKKKCDDPIELIINRLAKNKLIKKSPWYDFVFYTYKLVGDEKFIKNEIRTIYYQLLCNNAVIVNVVNGKVDIKNSAAKKFIFIKEIDIANDGLKISFLDLNDNIVHKEIDFEDYFIVNKKIYNNNMIAFNSLKFY